MILESRFSSLELLDRHFVFMEKIMKTCCDHKRKVSHRCSHRCSICKATQPSSEMAQTATIDSIDSDGSTIQRLDQVRNHGRFEK